MARAETPGTSTSTVASRDGCSIPISQAHAPFGTRVVNVGVRDSTYVLDGLLARGPTCGSGALHRTAGFTDHVFALMHLPQALPLRAAHPRPRRNQAACRGRRCKPTDVAPADRRHPEHQARACPLGRHPALRPARSSRAPSPPR